MKAILKLFTIKRIFILSTVVLFSLVVFNFYGPYTSKFYFFKPDNYIFPILSLVHFVFLYVLWFKTKEDEMTDPKMRNLEYALYVIFIIYVYKAFESIYVLTTYNDYEFHLLPEVFLPVGALVTALYILLIGLTLLAFKYRKDSVGRYRFNDIDHIDSWK